MLKKKIIRNYAGRLLAPVAAASLALSAAPHVFADESYEWEPGWGVHEEEWYDPSDWFDGEDGMNVEEVGNYGYDDSYYGNNVWSGYDYYGDYGYDYADYDTGTTGYSYYYQWTPEDSNWSEVEGDQATSDQMKTSAGEASEGKKKKDVAKKDVLTMRGEIQKRREG